MKFFGKPSCAPEKWGIKSGQYKQINYRLEKRCRRSYESMDRNLAENKYQWIDGRPKKKCG